METPEILKGLRERLAAVRAEKARLEAAIAALEGDSPQAPVRAATAQELLEAIRTAPKVPNERPVSAPYDIHRPKAREPGWLPASWHFAPQGSFA